MARILETFRQADIHRLRVPDAATPVRPYQPNDEVGIEETEDGELPFIEVGGPTGAVDGTAAFVAVRPRPTRNPVPPDEPAALATENTLVQVSFRPLPATSAPLRPACERFARELVAFHEPEHPVSEQYRTLLAGIESQLPAGQSQVLLFTAAAAGTGTSTVVLNLALSCALAGRRHTALVDANLLRPAVAERLGLPQAPGLREVLAGTLAPHRSPRTTGQEGLEVVAAGNVRSGDEALLAADGMRSLLQHLRGRFDLVLVDAPCWDGRPEVIALGCLCNAVYLVMSRAETDDLESDRLLQLIPQQGGRLRGCILAQR